MRQDTFDLGHHLGQAMSAAVEISKRKRFLETAIIQQLNDVMLHSSSMTGSINTVCAGAGIPHLLDDAKLPQQFAHTFAQAVTLEESARSDGYLVATMHGMSDEAAAPVARYEIEIALDCCSI